MPDHLQSRTSDQHKGVARHRMISPTTLILGVVIVAVIAGILLLA